MNQATTRRGVYSSAHGGPIHRARPRSPLTTHHSPLTTLWTFQHVKCRVVICRDQVPTIGRKRQVANKRPLEIGRELELPGPQLLAAGEVPELGRVVGANRGESLAVGAHEERSNGL